MRKVIFLICLLGEMLVFASCSKDEDDAQKHQYHARISTVYEAVIPRSLPLYPFSIYVLRLADAQNVYMLRWKTDFDLRAGDAIDYDVSRFCANEISRINGYELQSPDDVEKRSTGIVDTRSLIASDPFEADVIDLFEMDIIYEVPLLPVPTWCIEINDGSLLLCEKIKLQTGLQIGDHFVCNVYSLYPSVVLAIKKLR